MIVTNWELVAHYKYFDEGKYIFIFVEKLHPSIKFNTKSSIFLNTAHSIDIAVPSFNLALYKERDSGFTNIVFYHGCVSRNFHKCSTEYL